MFSSHELIELRTIAAKTWRKIVIRSDAVDGSDHMCTGVPEAKRTCSEAVQSNRIGAPETVCMQCVALLLVYVIACAQA